jgi:hypothetical protein
MTIEMTRGAEDPRMIRLLNPATNAYLHLSGQGETTDVNQSWLGFSYQAVNLRQRAAAWGEEWPYLRWGRNAHLSVPRENEL